MGNARSLTMVLSCVVVGTALMACDPQPPVATQSATDKVAADPVLQTQETGDAIVDGDKATRFHASGNEPFWSVKVSGATLVYTTPDIQPGVELAANRIDNATDVEFRGIDAGKDFVLIVTPGQCEDSMSGEMSDYTAIFSYGERQYTGCASAED